MDLQPLRGGVVQPPLFKVDLFPNLSNPFQLVQNTRFRMT